MRALGFIGDQHVLSATDVAQTYIWKAWTPQGGAYRVQTGYTGGPVIEAQARQRWVLYQVQMAVASNLGYHRQGHMVRLMTWGPPGYGGLYLKMHDQTGYHVWQGICPCEYGLGWGLYLGSRLGSGLSDLSLLVIHTLLRYEVANMS